MTNKLDRTFTRLASEIGGKAGQPLTFVVAVAIVVVWACTGPIFGYSETWQLVINTGTTIVTFLMVFLIQNSANRDTASMQAKLDELLYALDGAREKFIGIEHLTASEVEVVRAELEREVADDRTTKGKRVDESLKRLSKKL